MTPSSEISSMSLMDLVVNFVVICRQKGAFLPYEDYEVIKGWLAIDCKQEQIFLVLDEVLPDFYIKYKSSRQAPSLKWVDEQVKRKLKSFKADF